MTSQSTICDINRCVSLTGKATLKCDTCRNEDIHFWHVIFKNNPSNSNELCQKCIQSRRFAGMCDNCHTYYEDEKRIFHFHRINKTVCKCCASRQQTWFYSSNTEMKHAIDFMFATGTYGRGETIEIMLENMFRQKSIIEKVDNNKKMQRVYNKYCALLESSFRYNRDFVYPIIAQMSETKLDKLISIMDADKFTKEFYR
jgi:hypothetical protein